MAKCILQKQKKNKKKKKKHIDLSSTNEELLVWLVKYFKLNRNTSHLRLVLWNLMAILFHGVWEKSFLLIN